jgi:hypothetical protein
MSEKSFRTLLSILNENKVEFILIGGLAGMAHGAAQATFDVDVVYARTQENIQRLCDALKSHEPYLRGAPPGLPFKFDAETVKRGLSFTLQTTHGALDLLGGGFRRRKLPAAVAFYGNDYAFWFVDEVRQFGNTDSTETIGRATQGSRSSC